MKSPRTIEWFIAYRFLKEGRNQTLLIFAGAAVGVAVIVFLTALIAGLQVSLIDTTLGSQAHLVVEPLDEQTRPIYAVADDEVLVSRIEPRQPREQVLNRWQQLSFQIEQEPGILAIAPIADGPGFAIRGTAREPIQLRGVEVETYGQIIDISDRLTAGAFDLSDAGVILGATLAKNLNVTVDDRVRLAKVVFDLLRRINDETETAFLIVTHDAGLAEKCDRQLCLVDGRLVSDKSSSSRPL